MDKSALTALILEKINADKKIRHEWSHPEGTRTRYFVIDDLLPPEVCHQIYDAFPKDASGFYSRESFREKKRTSAQLSQYAPILVEITYALQSPEVVDLVANVVGFEGIEPDSSLYAGGLSMMFKGDFLNPHIDNSHDGERSRYRRLNLLYYVTPDWKLENGGNFELWDEDRKTSKTLTAKFNRLIVMETDKTSWHSVSPVTADSVRCCVSNYFFSKVSPDETEYFHVTSFTGRPNEIGKRALGVLDNALRNFVSKVLKIGRGKQLTNKVK